MKTKCCTVQLLSEKSRRKIQGESIENDIQPLSQWPVREHHFLRDGGHFTEADKKNMMDRVVPGHSALSPAGTPTCWILLCHIIVR